MDSVPPMSNLPTPAPLIIVPSGGGESVHTFGTEMLFHLTGKQTAGRSAVGTSIVPAHNPGPPPHCHEREDEIFFVQEGRMAFFSLGALRFHGREKKKSGVLEVSV